jgi:DNA-directed RNA polymerase subunit M/transcription elongation factor TFIIS
MNLPSNTPSKVVAKSLTKIKKIKNRETRKRAKKSEKENVPEKRKLEEQAKWAPTSRETFRCERLGSKRVLEWRRQMEHDNPK